MTEEFLQQVWKNKLVESKNWVSVYGESIEVLLPGEFNTGGGPDFFNARVRINGILWAGNIEIHLKSSDWIRHGHHQNPAYNNVILHVVYQHDEEVPKADGKPLCTLELKEAEVLFSRYRFLISQPLWVPCQAKLETLSSMLITSWLTSLTTERLEQKIIHIKNILERNTNHWEETCYHALARNFGFKTNADAFERLARSLPLMILAKHKYNLKQTEALLFGQAGFLEKEVAGDEYFSELKKEYIYLQNKFHLLPIESHAWQFMRMRPVNFPSIRIAQFAMLVHRSSGMFSQLIHAPNLEEIQRLFTLQTSPYWETHYIFRKPSHRKIKHLGEDAFQNLVINSIVPLLFTYAQSTGNSELREKALGYLEQLPPEKNSLVNHWTQAGIKAVNAFESQALIQLKNQYCKSGRCIDCRIGVKLIQSKL